MGDCLSMMELTPSSTRLTGNRWSFPRVGPARREEKAFGLGGKSCKTYRCGGIAFTAFLGCWNRRDGLLEVYNMLQYVQKPLYTLYGFPSLKTTLRLHVQKYPLPVLRHRAHPFITPCDGFLLCIIQGPAREGS